MSRSPPPRPAREVLSDAADAARPPAEVINEIASELNLLSSSWTNPDAFLERRDFLTKRLRRLAKRMTAEPPRRSSPFGAPQAPLAMLGRTHRAAATPAKPGRPILTLTPGGGTPTKPPQGVRP